MNKRVYIFLIFIFSYLLLKYAARIDNRLVDILFWINLLVFTNIVDLYMRFIRMSRNLTQKTISPLFTRQLYLYILLSLAFFLFLQIGWERIPWLKENLDPASILFLVFFPAIWSFNLKRFEIARIAITTLIVTLIFIINITDSSAETFAIFTYLLLGTVTIQGLKEIIIKPYQHG